MSFGAKRGKDGEETGVNERHSDGLIILCAQLCPDCEDILQLFPQPAFCFTDCLYVPRMSVRMRHLTSNSDSEARAVVRIKIYSDVN